MGGIGVGRATVGVGVGGSGVSVGTTGVLEGTLEVVGKTTGWTGVEEVPQADRRTEIIIIKLKER